VNYIYTEPLQDSSLVPKPRGCKLTETAR